MNMPKLRNRHTGRHVAASNAFFSPRDFGQQGRLADMTPPPFKWCFRGPLRRCSS
jgi:hypothetical protein